MVSISLVINGTCYSVKPVPGCDPQLVRRAFSLEKVKLAGELPDPDRPAHDGYYHVVESARGNVSCDCPDFIFRREGQDPRGCKHVLACQAAGLIAAPSVSDQGPSPEALRAAAADQPNGLTLAETLRLARRITSWVVTHPDLDWRGIPADEADMALEAAMIRLGVLNPPCQRCREDYSVAGDTVCATCREDLCREAEAHDAAAEWDAQKAAAAYDAEPPAPF
jgi:hypothetical protein